MTRITQTDGVEVESCCSALLFTGLAGMQHTSPGVSAQNRPTVTTMVLREGRAGTRLEHGIRASVRSWKIEADGVGGSRRSSGSWNQDGNVFGYQRPSVARWISHGHALAQIDPDRLRSGRRVGGGGGSRSRNWTGSRPRRQQEPFRQTFKSASRIWIWPRSNSARSRETPNPKRDLWNPSYDVRANSIAQRRKNRNLVCNRCLKTNSAAEVQIGTRQIKSRAAARDA